MLRHSLPEAARARLRPSVGLLSRNAIGGAVPANPGVRSGRRQGHRLVCPNRKVKTNHPDILAVRVNPGARNGRSRGRLTLSPNRKVKTPNPTGNTVPANPDVRSGRRRGRRCFTVATKVKTESPLRYASRMVAALQSPGSLLTGFVHRCRPVFPRPPSRLQSPDGAALRAAPSGDSHPLPSAPKGLPLRLRAAPDDRFASTGATLRLKSPSLCPVPADVASLRLPVLALFHGRLRVLRTLRSSAQT
ncbi:MAG: hypothetical protein NT047_09485 [Deltaproteobacteria bacterium]|nr:hypothetical protein [Deltaproteobacteria bacterium]